MYWWEWEYCSECPGFSSKKNFKCSYCKWRAAMRMFWSQLGSAIKDGWVGYWWL